jgi:hypothetical protein
MACALAVLWEDFGADLGGGEGYFSHTPAERAEYVTFLRQGAHRVRQNGGQEKLHFALAAELMALYVEAIGALAPSTQDRETAAAIAEIAAQGTLIRKAGAGLRPKRRHLNA